MKLATNRMNFETKVLRSLFQIILIPHLIASIYYSSAPKASSIRFERELDLQNFVTKSYRSLRINKIGKQIRKDKLLAFNMDEDSVLENPTTWMEWFLLRDSALQVNKHAKKTLFDTFYAEKNTAQIQLNLLKNDETVFLFKQNFGINKINCFHHLSTIGGNIYNPQEYFGAIQGVDKYITSVVTPDMNQLLEISSVAAPVPSIEDFMKMNSLEDYRSLKPSQTNYYTARNFIPIPPFLSHTVNKAIIESNRDSKHLLMATIQTIREFDEEIDRMEDNIIKTATDTWSDILYWIYLATKGKINSIPTVG